MENDILDALEDIGYTGPMLEDGALEKAIEGGPKSIEYTELVSWLSNELKTLCNLEEHVNAITSPDDSSSFIMEVSSFLKELGCPHKSLTEGHLSERLTTKVSRILFLEFLVCELEAARMIKVKKPTNEKGMQVELKESPTAGDLKAMLIALKFPKPPANITSSMLFGKLEQKVKEVVAKAPSGLVGKPLFFGTLSGNQWHTLMGIQQELHEEYRMRREMLLKRLDVTIQSFLWSERAKSQEDRIAQIFQSKRAQLRVEPTVQLSHVLAAREDLAVLEKTSCASVRKHTQSQINKVIIGKVPDRGGRPSEQQPPPPEMPSWQQRPSESVSNRSVKDKCENGTWNTGSLEVKGMLEEVQNKMDHVSVSGSGKRFTDKCNIGQLYVGMVESQKVLDVMKCNMKHLSVDILGVTETRWDGKGDFWSDEYRVIHSGDFHKRYGVAMMLRKEWGERVKFYNRFNGRLLLVRIGGEPTDTVLVQISMPTSEDPDEDCDRMYENLEEVIKTVNKEDNLIILGTWNAFVGEGKEGTIVGFFGHGKRDSRGEKLVEFCRKKEMSLVNTLFKQHYRANVIRRKTEVDFILVREKYFAQVKDCQSYHPGRIKKNRHFALVMQCNLKKRVWNYKDFEDGGRGGGRGGGGGGGGRVQGGWSQGGRGGGQGGGGGGYQGGGGGGYQGGGGGGYQGGGGGGGYQGGGGGGGGYQGGGGGGYQGGGGGGYQGGGGGGGGGYQGGGRGGGRGGGGGYRGGGGGGRGGRDRGYQQRNY
ncbi:uncharacterized protein LOC124166455 [Ischnura elegans]|uniref:uncharacterized protein LOC124166455 n=1 Tax=Ischnura elegans TaxID=197161 RepID=UPI001ED8BD16|nr:uncharacterized protein LOC124166455 [Ischnura elegans]